MSTAAALACVLALSACGGGLRGQGLPLGFAGTMWCDVVAATGSVGLDAQRRVRAPRLGRGEITCADRTRIEVEVRQAARVDIRILKQPAAGEAVYVYTDVYDAEGHDLWSQSDQFEWSAHNAEIEPGTCAAYASPGCIANSTAATLRAAPPSATVEVRYLGARSIRTIPVRPSDTPR